MCVFKTVCVCVCVCVSECVCMGIRNIFPVIVAGWVNCLNVHSAHEGE